MGFDGIFAGRAGPNTAYPCVFASLCALRSELGFLYPACVWVSVCVGGGAGGGLVSVPLNVGAFPRFGLVY